MGICMGTDMKSDKSQQLAEEIVGTVVYIETEVEIPGWIGRGGGSGFTSEGCYLPYAWCCESCSR